MKNSEILQDLKKLINDKNIKEIRNLFDDNQLIDMVDSVQKLNVRETLFIFKALSKDVSGELFAYLDSDRQKELIDAFTGPQIQSILENLYSDDIVDMLGDLPANLTKKVLLNTTSDTRREINLLLSFPEDSAGSIMSCDFFELQQDDTVEQAIAKLKKQGEAAETINTCYVINQQRVLVGSILLKNFLFESPELILKDIMETNPVSVTTLMDQETVADLIKKYDITIVPVVNDEHRLIGIITVDDIMDIMEEEVTEDIHRMNAVQPIEQSYANASVWSITKSRLPWLLILMITDTFNGLIIGHYEAALMAVPALTGFLPAVMGTAGNGGGQASTMVIRGLATNDIHPKDIFKVIIKELIIGLICSAVLFAISYLKITLFPSDIVAASGALKVAFTVAGSMCIALMVGKMVGGVLPLLVSALHLDPASVAAPLITTIADTTGLLIYFAIATMFFKL